MTLVILHERFQFFCLVYASLTSHNLYMKNEKQHTSIYAFMRWVDGIRFKKSGNISVDRNQTRKKKTSRFPGVAVCIITVKKCYVSVRELETAEQMSGRNPLRATREIKYNKI